MDSLGSSSAEGFRRRAHIFRPRLYRPTAARVKPAYSSSRLVTLCLSPFVFPAGDEFQWGEVGERLMGAHAVVGVFPMAQLVIEAWWLVGVRVHLVELFMVGAVRALDVGIQFG